MRQCNTCLQVTDESEFYKDKSRKGGLAYRCKKCMANQSKAYYEKYREERLAKVNKRYKNKQMEILTYHKRYRRENPEAHGKVHKKADAKRERNLGWEPLFDNPFNETEKITWHHIDDIHVVAIPGNLHTLYNSGRNREFHRINLSYIVEQIYAHRF